MGLYHAFKLLKTMMKQYSASVSIQDSTIDNGPVFVFHCRFYDDWRDSEFSVNSMRYSYPNDIYNAIVFLERTITGPAGQEGVVYINCNSDLYYELIQTLQLFYKCTITKFYTFD
jgi:hypothetical protein